MYFIQICITLLWFLCAISNFNFAYEESRSPRVRRIVGGSPAEIPPPDDPLVFVNYGGRFAKIKGVLEFPHYIFKGIRYAHPPTKKRRFQRPKQFFLEGDVNATVFPPPCIQPLHGENRIIGSEDCLFLNIYTSELPLGTEGLPVIVWIHGGGFRFGSASQYGAKHFVKRKVVFVTIQYRLGSLGFLSLGSKEFPGNLGLWDMVMAVKWVRNYIGFFGGNPFNIIVSGQGTGASAAMLMALNRVAKGLSSGIVAMSGTALSNWATEKEPLQVALQVAQLVGCPNSTVTVLIACLRSLPAEIIVKADSKVQTNRINTEGFLSAMASSLGLSAVMEGRHDGRSLPNMIEDKPLNQMPDMKIPLLTGVTKEETKRAVMDVFKDEITNKLKTVPDFINKVLPKDLGLISSLGQMANSTAYTLFSVPSQLEAYFTPLTGDTVDDFKKISEVTADALFNLPAYLSVDKWSEKGTPSFLYSFEHSPKVKKAQRFLLGLPFIGNGSIRDDSVSHGDDLAFLFDAYTLEGKPLDLNDDFTEEDLKVRSVFINTIVNFARHKKVSVNNEDLLGFSKSSSKFLKISSTPSIGENFRLCAMGFWTGFTGRLQDASSKCKVTSVPKQIINVPKKIINIPKNIVPSISNPWPFG